MFIGHAIQVYRDEIPGASSDAKFSRLRTELDRIHLTGQVDAVVMHGFPRELPAKFHRLAVEVSVRGMACGASFGLDGERDDDGSSYTGKEKGQMAVEVSKDPLCHSLTEDAEGKWDGSSGDQDHTSKKDAIDYANELIAGVPEDTCILNQTWWKPDVHSGFPYDEFAKRLTAWAPQLYANNMKAQWGKRRWDILLEGHNKSWEKMALTHSGMRLPRFPTIQGYGWDDIPEVLISVLLSYEDLIIWCEPFPSAMMYKCIAVEGKLESLGLPGPKSRWVVEFQKNEGLTIDGVCGPLTRAKLGFNW